MFILCESTAIAMLKYSIDNTLFRKIKKNVFNPTQVFMYEYTMMLRKVY